MTRSFILRNAVAQLQSPVVRLASRGSPLARAQVQEVLPLLRDVFSGDARFEIKTISTPGDRDKKTALGHSTIPDDFFTRDLDEALRKNKADLIVHSAKDLPQQGYRDLTIAALLPATDIRDALVVRKHILKNKIKTIGTSSPKREEEIKQLFPQAVTKPIRGTIQERLKQLNAGHYDAIIVAACALNRLGLTKRISEYLPYDPAPQQGRLALVCRSKDKELIEMLKKIDVRRSTGLVALVGCPADASLLSVRAQRYLEQADIILHDRLIPDDVVLKIKAKSKAVGKVGGHHSTAQNEIHRSMLHEAEAGKLVVRLHGGDPGIYGRLAEELEFLSAWNIRYDVVPAITAAQVAAANARSPLTHRGAGHRVTIISGKPQLAAMPRPNQGNLALYMGVTEIKETVQKLYDEGWSVSTPVVIAERLGYRDEQIRYSTLKALSSLTIEAPAVFLIGAKSFTNCPTTLFVGTDPDHFLKHGPLIHWPLIKLVSRPLKERIALIKNSLEKVDGLLFPSRFAVNSFMEALMHDQDVRALGDKFLLAVGPATEAELARYGLRADGAADNLGGVHELAKEIKKNFKGRYLYPCSDASPQRERIRALKEHGIELLPTVFYNNREMPYKELPRLPFHRVLFTSSTTVKAYFSNYPKERKAKRTWLAVGPSTQDALHTYNLDVEVI